MSIKSIITTAAVTAVAAAGLASPASAGVTPAGMGTIGTAPQQPSVAMSHAEWRHCWKTIYANYRADGFSPQSSTTAADWTCGSAPTK